MSLSLNELTSRTFPLKMQVDIILGGLIINWLIEA